MILKKIKKLGKDKKGEISILVVIFLFVLVIAVDAMIGISSSMFGISGLQSKIDIAGVNALYDSIDLDALKDNKLGVVNGGGSISIDGSSNQGVVNGAFRSVIKRKYENELNKIKFPGENMRILRTDVDFEYSDFGIGFDSSTSYSQQRPQIVLESIISYDVVSSSAPKNVDKINKKNINSARSGTTIQISVAESSKKGYQTIIVHSITRLALK